MWKYMFRQNSQTSLEIHYNFFLSGVMFYLIRFFNPKKSHIFKEQLKQKKKTLQTERKLENVKISVLYRVRDAGCNFFSFAKTVVTSPVESMTLHNPALFATNSKATMGLVERDVLVFGRDQGGSSDLGTSPRTSNSPCAGARPILRLWQSSRAPDMMRVTLGLHLNSFTSSSHSVFV